MRNKIRINKNAVLFFALLLLSLTVLVPWLTPSSNDQEDKHRTELQLRSESGNVESMWVLANYLKNNDRDFAQYRYWLKMAGENGHIDAMVSLGDCYSEGSASFARDEKKAQFWFHRAAAKGDQAAMSIIALSYKNSTDSIESTELGRLWSRLSVSKTRREKEEAKGIALFELAKLYDDGNGIDQDKRKAIKLLAVSIPLKHAYTEKATQRFLKILRSDAALAAEFDQTRRRVTGQKNPK